MKNLIYAALFAVVAASMAGFPANATPSNDLLTTSGPPRALRITKTSQPTMPKSETIAVRKLKADSTQPTASSTSSPAVTVPVVSGPPMWWRTGDASQK